MGSAAGLVNPTILRTSKQPLKNDIRPTPTVYAVSPIPNPTAQISRKVAVPTTDPDPVIDCEYKYLGNQKIRKSVCDVQFECQLGDVWYFYRDRIKCKDDQNAYYKSGSIPNYTYPTYAPLPTWKPLPTYKPYPTYSYEPYPENDEDTSSPQISKDQCISDVNDKYRSKMTSLGCAYPCPDTGDCGSTGTCAFIWSQAQAEMNSCTQYQ